MMMKNLVITFCFLIVGSGCAFSQEVQYDVSSIADSVKKNASVIKRYEEIVFEVSDIDRASLTSHQVFTILTDKGKNALSFTEFTNKYISLEEAEIKLYDANGKQISRYKKKDFSQHAVGEGLIFEGMYNHLEITTPSYPVTVDYKYQLNYKGTLNYPTYSILSPGEAVEQSSFVAKVPKDLDLRYTMQKIKFNPEITEDAKFKYYKWSVKHLPAIEYEEGSSKSTNCYPAVLLAPNRFRIYDHEGDMSSWKNFGTWENNLLKDLEILPDERKTFYTNLVKNAKDEREKIGIVYEYLQKNFRYVSIQLGIGGYKPFPANFTDSKKYGDCKGLSFYTYSVLKMLGIKSYVALINAEYNNPPVDPAFPSNQFNHMILCVPGQKDTIWLECTSKTIDFGVLGTSTENRNALLITDDGGILVPTPKSISSENKSDGFTKVVLKDDGSGNTSTLLRSTGDYKEIMNYIAEEKKDDQKESIVLYLGFKNPDEFALTKKDEAGSCTSIDLQVEKIPEFIAGNKMFLSPRIYKIWSSKLPKSENRKQDFYFQCPFEKTDTTVYILPAGYKEDAMPQAKEMKCDFATYSTKYWFDARTNQIFSTARFVLTQNKIPADKYAGVKKFFDEILLDDAQKIVIKKD